MRSYFVFAIALVVLTIVAPIAPASAQTPAITKLVTATQLKVNKAVAGAVAKEAKAVAKALIKFNKLILKDPSEDAVRAQATVVVSQMETLIEKSQIALQKALDAAEIKLDKLVAKNPDLEAEAAAALADLSSHLDESFTTLDAALSSAQSALELFVNYVDPTPPQDE